jgi:pyruvate carboxylase
LCCVTCCVTCVTCVTRARARVCVCVQSLGSEMRYVGAGTVEFIFDNRSRYGREFGDAERDLNSIVVFVMS